MLTVIKNIFTPTKDYAGRDIDTVICRLAEQTATETHCWSYLNNLSVYENTQTGARVYPHELSQYAT